MCEKTLLRKYLGYEKGITCKVAIVTEILAIRNMRLTGLSGHYNIPKIIIRCIAGATMNIITSCSLPYRHYYPGAENFIRFQISLLDVPYCYEITSLCRS